MLYELTLPAANVPIHQTATTNCISPVQQKDYSRPLHVDCSVEYELPSQVKPPPPTNGKIDPLLMIHPCYFRKIEAQRRSPFINNLPGRGVSTTVSSNSTSSSSTSTSTSASASITSLSIATNRQMISEQTNSNSNPSTVCHNRSHHNNNNNNNNNIIKTQQQPQQQYPTTIPQHYHQMPNSVRHPHHVWPTDQQPSTVGTKHAHHPHQLPSCAGVSATNALYNATTATIEGGLWTNTNRSHHSPLAAERFPEPQVTLHQMQPTITVTDNSTTTINTSCSKNHLLTTSGKYRQYLRTHRLHPYMSMATSAFPQFTQMQQISCYNV